MTSPRRDAFVVTIVYLALTIVMTWPLAAGLTRDIPGDFGDPLFSVVGDGVGRDAPGARLVEREHLRAASAGARLLGALPAAGAAGAADLRRDAAIRSSATTWSSSRRSSLSGLGMFLLGRELTGSRAAGFVAGLAFAFSPFRIASIPHLQVLSSAWMPFVLYGLRRHFVHGPRCGRSPARPPHGSRRTCRAATTCCSSARSSLLYIAWEMTTRGLWTRSADARCASAPRARRCSRRRCRSCCRTSSCGGSASTRGR